MNINLTQLASHDRKMSTFEKIRKSLSGPGGTIVLGLVIIISTSAIWVGKMTFTSFNIYLILAYLAIPLIIGIFASFSLLAGVVDLSIGAMVALSATVFALLCVYDINKWVAACITVLICMGFGAINGTAIVVFGANPIAATLGMLVGLRGLARILSHLAPGTGSSQDAISLMITGLNDFTESQVSFMPVLFIIALVLVFITQGIISMTRGGRHIRAVGGDITAARRAGLPTERIKFFSLLASSFGASIGGILYVGKLGSAPVTLGTNMEFTIYAALMIGGYSILRGGVGNPMGGFLGLLIIAVFANLVDNKGLDIRAADIFVGFLLLVIVFLDIRRGGDAFE
jgi:ribose/xylose/arabinose/galactoside ABC-type transport system permease subunit